MTVIGCTPHGRELALKEHLIAIFAQLMRPVDSGHVVFLKEALAYIFTENVACASSRHAEAQLVSIRITPHQIGKWTLMWYFLYPLNRLNVIDLVQRR